MEEFDKKFASLKRKWMDSGKEIQKIHEQGKKALSDGEEVSAYKGMFRVLERFFTKYEAYWDEIHDLHAEHSKTFPSKDDLTVHQAVKGFYYKCNEFYETLCKENLSQTTQQNFTMSESRPSHSLPKITLPKFDGQVINWPKFRDTFTSLVHNETSLSSMQKYHYLVSSLSGPASAVICHLPMEEGNYTLAWDALIKAFNNKRMLACAYLNKLVNFKPLLGKPSVESLKTFLMKVSDNISAFKLLGIENEADFILFHLAIKCLDPTTREQFELANKHNEFPSFDNLTKFIRDRCLALQLAEGASSYESLPEKSKDKTFRPNVDHRLNRTSLLAEKTNDKKVSLQPLTCFVCHEGAHKLLSCLTFSNATPKMRVQMLTNWKGCRNCLSYNHQTSACTSQWHCRFCKCRHHSMLHLDTSSSKAQPFQVQGSRPTSVQHLQPSSSTEKETVNTLNTTSQQDEYVILGTALACIEDARGIYQKVRLVIDGGSQCSFITQKCANRLGLSMSRCDRRISGIGQTPYDEAKGVVSCMIKPISDTHPGLFTNAVVVKSIVARLPSVPLPTIMREKFKDYILADPTFWKPAEIDLLLGADMYGEIWTGSIIAVDDSLPKLFPSIFGNVIIGKCPLLADSSEMKTSLFTKCDSSDLRDDLQRFWELEEPSKPAKCLSPEDEICEQQFIKTHSRTKEGRYIVRLPFKEEPPSFVDSKFIALKRLQNLEMKLARNPELKCKYHEFLKEYLEVDHMSTVNTDSKCLIPHHPVCKEEGNDLKLRVVFDASAKTFINHSLNDYLLAGPKLQTDIREVLLNFRSHPFVFVADVVQMYRNILVHEDDRPYQHILWRFNSTSEIQTYALNTVTYGLTSSPFLALRVLEQLKIDEGAKYPLSADIIGRDVYIDDILTGSSSISEALDLQTQTIDLFARGGFTLSKWASNCADLLKHVSQEKTCETMKLIAKEDLIMKILGLQWDSREDHFKFTITLPRVVYTKRGILSVIAKIYDPLGFLSPVIFLMKSFIQDIWKEGLEWDQTISKNLLEQWDKIIQQLPEMSKVKIPRFVCSEGSYTYQVVGFADASTKGYCAVIYLRCISTSLKVSLLTAKTKLAPLKTISVPRLELCAALLLSKLYKSISGFLNRLPGNSLEPYFFSDSTIVLGWLNTPPFKLTTFVANRISEISTLTVVSQWKHIDSASNPSDCGSRGMLPHDFVNHTLWWSGPKWLQEHEDKWPISRMESNEDLPELKKEPIALLSPPCEPELITWMSRFSSFDHLLRVLAWTLRFTYNCQNQGNLRHGPLSLSEINAALSLCVKEVQSHYIFKENLEKKCDVFQKFHKLGPFLDDLGILRVGGRLRHSDLPHDHKYPYLLPKRCHFTTLVVDHYHQQYLHPGPSLLQAMIQHKFWIPSLRRLAQNRTYQCIKCFKLKAKISYPIMGDLPRSRLSGGRAFQHVGIDFAGPLMMRDSLRRKASQSKVYLCLFVCMATKALHLELVTSLSTEAFLACLDRFVSRRGLPSQIYSDCGTNFIGAANYLKELLQWFNTEVTKSTVVDYSVKKGITWNFNPPHSPHFGGLWEAGVKSVKRLLRTTVGENSFTYEELSTYVMKIESILNSRPLCPLSNDPTEMNYLTPGHFIIGRPLVAIPEPSLLDLKENTLSRWQLVKRITEHFWKRWRVEYLSTLQQKSKWTKNSENLKIGDLVLLKEDFVPVSKWPLGRVTATYPGRDGVVRVATVKTQKSTFQRPTVKLVPLLPINQKDS